jgi:chromosome segregation ATPase
MNLSDVPGSFGRISARNSTKQQSLNNLVRSYQPKVDQIDDRPRQLQNYSQQLSSTEKQIAREKTDLRSEVARLTEEFRIQEYETEQQMRRVAEQYERLKAKQNECKEMVKAQQHQLAELKAEATRIDKRIEWSDSILGKILDSTGIEPLRAEVLKLVSQIDDENSGIRDIRSKILTHQQHLLWLGDALAPLRVRQFLLKSRLESAEVDNGLADARSALANHFMDTKQIAVDGQHLAIHKMKLQKQVNDLQGAIQEKRAMKAELMQSILPLRAQDDAALNVILGQIEHYRTAANRTQQLILNATRSKHDSISHELDLKLERDQLTKERELVDDQMRLVEGELSRQENEAATLSSWLSMSDHPEEIAIETEEQILSDIISKIHKQREIEKELCQTKITPPSLVTDSFAQQAKRAIRVRLRKMESVLQSAQEEVEALAADVRQEEERLQLEIERKICPPKISHGRSQVSILESSVAATSKQCESARTAVDAQRTRFKKLIGQLDFSRHGLGLRRDLYQKVERSLNWLLPNVRKQKRTWNETTSAAGFGQLLADWDLKIVNASINEVEDLAVRAAVLNTPTAS